MNKNESAIEILNEVKDDEPKRETWGRGVEFLMSCISLSVGLGNIWRFPFKAYENGGGAFLLPYIIVLFLVGKPLYFFEMILGQFASKGSVKSISILPVLKGVTIGQQITAFMSFSYASLMAIISNYLVKSFYRTLPWSYCWDEWNDVHCVPSDSKLNATENFKNLTSKSSSELYYIREVTKQKDQIDDGIGLPDLELSIYAFAVWILIFLVIIKGAKSTGKASYFLAIFPYIVLTILLIRALTLEGAWDGIKFFIVPVWSKLLEPQVWFAAIGQLFFSLSVGYGTITMFASYNKFDHNIYRDALIVTSMDTFTSVLGGFVVFGILGNLAHNTGEKDVGKVIQSGASGLAFISYPDAIGKFTFAPQLFAVLFFSMLFTLSMGSSIGFLSTIISNLKDVFISTKQWVLALLSCFVGFLTSLVFVTPGGQWVLVLNDFFSVFITFINAILMITLIIWIYGLENFCWDAEFMLKWKVTKFWRISWGILTPGLLLLIFIYSMAKFELPKFANKFYPTEAYIAGFFIFAVGISQIFLWSFFMVIRREKSVKELFQPNPIWGPKSAKTFSEWKEFKSEKKARRKVESKEHSKMKKILWILSGKYQ